MFEPSNLLLNWSKNCGLDASTSAANCWPTLRKASKLVKLAPASGTVEPLAWDDPWVACDSAWELEVAWLEAWLPSWCGLTSELNALPSLE